MKSIAEIQSKADELRIRAGKQWEKADRECDFYKQIPLRVVAERLDSSANALEWVLEEIRYPRVNGSEEN